MNEVANDLKGEFLENAFHFELRIITPSNRCFSVRKYLQEKLFEDAKDREVFFNVTVDELREKMGASFFKEYYNERPMSGTDGAGEHNG